MHTYTHTPTHTYTYTHLHLHTPTHMHTYTYTHRAYTKDHMDILKLLQSSGVVDLCSDNLTLSSTHTPLFLDALQRNPKFLQVFLESKNPNDAFNHIYEHNTATSKARENGMSILIKMYPQDELATPLSGHDLDPVPSPLAQALQTFNITQVMLPQLGLKDVPPAIFGDCLKHLELQGNELTTLPLAPLRGEGQPPPCPSLTFLNVSANKLKALPSALFHCPNLSTLYAASNDIRDLPMDLWLAPKLETLSLMRNFLRELPCPPSIPLDVVARHCPPGGVGVGGGGGGGGDGEDSGAKGYAPQQQGSLVRSLRRMHVSSEFDSSADDPSQFQLGCVLETLDLTDNQLSDIPCGLSCLAPALKTLKLAANMIRFLGFVGNFPPAIVTLDVSKNALAWAFSPPHQYLHHGCYQAKLRNTPLHCSHGNHTKLGQLRILSLFDNQLERVSVLNESVSPPEVMFPRLSSLKLSKNRLRQVPDDIHRLVGLSELAIDGNTSIEHLPLRIHLLEQLFSFKFEGIRDPIVHELSNLRTASEMRYYLRARETK